MNTQAKKVCIRLRAIHSLANANSGIMRQSFKGKGIHNSHTNWYAILNVLLYESTGNNMQGDYCSAPILTAHPGQHVITVEPSLVEHLPHHDSQQWYNVSVVQSKDDVVLSVAEQRLLGHHRITKVFCFKELTVAPSPDRLVLLWYTVGLELLEYIRYGLH